jgi:hypothetical protein
VYRKRLHNDARDFGLTVMTDEQLAEASTLDELPGMIDRADEVDAFWSERVPGFRPQNPRGPKQILTFRGLYAGLYRQTSRYAHAQIETIGECIDFSAYPRRPAIVAMEHADDLMWLAVAVPMTAMALLVCHYRFGWPDGEVVRGINDALLYDVELADE